MRFNANAKRLTIALTGTLLVLLTGAALAEPFEFVEEVTVSPPPPGTGVHGLALVGDQWFMANFAGGWNVYDLDFMQVGTTTTDVPSGGPRGLCYDSNAGSVFLGDYSSNTIHECMTDGTVLNSFASTGGQLNALAFDPNTDHLFALHFEGYVAELTRDGALVNSFTIGDTWTGAAFDAANNTLLLMNSNEDQVLEYMTDGTLVDTVIAGDCVGGNGQGLAYDAESGVLHCTSQYGNVAVWERDGSVGTETATWSDLKSLYR